MNVVDCDRSGHRIAGGSYTGYTGRMAITDIRTKILQRIRVDSSGCWIWIGYRKKNGYGELTINRKKVMAHRASYAAFVKDPGRLFVCHHCDNPPCVNPSHLFSGTNHDNVLDSVKKGRRPRNANPRFGETHGMSKLTNESVLKIRGLKGSISQSIMSEMFGVSDTVIGEVLRRETWKHI